MKKLYLILVIVFTILISNTDISAQATNKKITKYETSIQKLFERIIKSKNDLEKTNVNEEIIVLFEKALKEKNSFEYEFNKLVNISKLKSSDNQLKIITWNLPLSDGTYKYFGFVQYLKKKSTKPILLKLNDMSDNISSPEQKILSNKKWLGALYYKILTNTYKDKTYYTLLAWDGNNDFTNKKIIDLIYVKNKSIYFGQPVFKFGNKTLNRIVFEYTNQAKMMLKYDKKLKLIVFDHLSPSQKKFKGQYIYYGPDMTHDGLEFEKGFWLLKSNIVLKNSASDNKGKPVKTSY